MVSSTSSQISYIDNKQPLLNRTGYIPVVSTVTGTIRVVGATFIAVYQIAKAVFYQIAISIETLKHRSGNENALADKIVSLQQQKNDALGLVQNMLLHIGRGLIEVVPFVGNLACKIYDKKAEPNNKALKDQFLDLKKEIENTNYRTVPKKKFQDIITRLEKIVDALSMAVLTARSQIEEKREQRMEYDNKFLDEIFKEQEIEEINNVKEKIKKLDEYKNKIGSSSGMLYKVSKEPNLIKGFNKIEEEKDQENNEIKKQFNEINKILYESLTKLNLIESITK